MARPDDPRLGELIISRAEFDNHAQQSIRGIGLINFPCDEGVSRNGGRPGAREGPAVVMNMLPRFGCLNNRELNIDLKKSNIRIVNYGTARGETLEDSHDMLRSFVTSCLQSGLFPLSIGGGNDQSWANGSAWINALRGDRKATDSTIRLTIINVDAHLDVRPLVSGTNGQPQTHSGSPFRQLVEMAKSTEDLELVEFAAQGQQCSSDHVDFVLKNGGRIFWLSEIKTTNATNQVGNPFNSSAASVLKSILSKCEATARHVFFSFDLDAIRASDCPGVSCPSPVGLSSEEALEMCYIAGSSSAVELMDISEFNPGIESDRTGRLVVQMIYYFTMGFSQRRS